jgi:ribosomal protein S18 acetylase RimI-like enzyme
VTVDIRSATRDDAAAVAELFASLEESVVGRPSRLDEDVVLHGWWQTLPLETNTWLLEEDGTLVAAAFGQIQGGRGVFGGAVRPSAQGRGLGARLIDLAEARLAEEGAPRLHAWAQARDEPASQLFRQRGYREVRRFWEMGIELDEEPPEPAVPVETFREEDARAFHAALEEAFEDHWEPHPESFDEWWSRQRARPGYDPSLWSLIRDGEEIAAAVRNDGNFVGGGYVGSLGVRRPWRGRGYGRALLLHSFREFRRRGMPRAALGVDAANPTGATHLYESVGMHVELEEIVWEKSLS